MTQGQALGVTVGSTRTIAAIGSATANADPADIAVHIRRQRLASMPELSENLLARVGDPVDILLPDGSAVAAADLVAETITQVVSDFSAVSTVATVPAWWSVHTVEAQRQALARAGSETVVLVPEPLAALRHLTAGTAVPDDSAVVVYDLGATGITVSVVGSGAGSGLLAGCVRSTEISGAEFDLSIMRYVLANAMGEKDFDPFDPVVERELSALRRRCALAKHHLSRNTATTIEVRLAGTTREVRLVRDEVEDLLRAPLTDSLRLVHEAVRRAGIGSDEIGRILLTGGGASTGLLTELISAEFTAPLTPLDDPGSLSTRGAALLAADLWSESRSAAARAAAPVPIARAALAPDESETSRLPALGDRTVVEPPPADTAAPVRSGRRRRVAFFAGAAIAVGALASGTLALGTTGTPAPTSATSPAAATSTAVAAPANSAHPGVIENATVNSTGTNRANTAANPVAAPDVTAPGAPASNPPGTGAPAPAAPAPAAAPAPNSPDTPAPGTPAPAANSPTQPAPPAQSPPPATQQPTAPTHSGTPGSQLGNTLNNSLDQVGDTVGTVLQVPGKVLPHQDK
ncbi:Hsp70-like protein [Nocardia nova SH22a]|uniref:Hsp70-like protein n=1 Tax=Nocardia nova SH22a TaxID=1415166 RepID=W5TRN4_9NOCA|nr:Hsp70 family protein [Nocardia nova]AHH22040.1 Hsp70-like protein [Nocardia nova SH22a]